MFHGFNLISFLDEKCILEHEKVHEEFYESNEKSGFYIENSFAEYLGFDLEFRLGSLLGRTSRMLQTLQDSETVPIQVHYTLINTLLSSIVEEISCTITNFPLNEPLYAFLSKTNADLVKYNGKDINQFKNWWFSEGESWLSEFNKLMIDFEIINEDVHISKAQEALLRKYYDANDLLIRCLNINNSISLILKEEIRELLFLTDR